MVYVAGWLLNYLAVVLRLLGFQTKLFDLLPFLLIGAIIVLRNSGTDTHAYEAWIKSLEDRLDAFLLEPGFILTAQFFLWLTGSEVWALRGIGVLFMFLLFVYWLRSDRDELNLFILYLVPVFVYPYGMNAVRAGLGLSLLLLGWQYLRRNKKGHFIILALISVMFHYSMLLPASLLALSELKMKAWRQILMVSLFILAATALVFSQQNYLSAKLELYSSSESPSSASGLSRIVMLIILLLGFSLGALSFKTKLRAWAVIFGLGAFFQGLAFVSYAGLRFLELLVFATPLVLLREFLILTFHKPLISLNNFSVDIKISKNTCTKLCYKHSRVTIMRG
ncbi:MAG: EpsG family protein [Candidatus Jordarchaeaceae archaeon]